MLKIYKEMNLSTDVSILSCNISVFISADDANEVIKRQRRASSLLFEEVLPGSLERECLEERCTHEEAREVFENDEMLVSILFTCVLWFFTIKLCPAACLICLNFSPYEIFVLCISAGRKQVFSVVKMEMQRLLALTLLKASPENDVFCDSCCKSIWLLSHPYHTQGNTASAPLGDQEGKGAVGVEGSNVPARSATYRKRFTWSGAASPLAQEALLTSTAGCYILYWESGWRLCLQGKQREQPSNCPQAVSVLWGKLMEGRYKQSGEVSPWGKQ